MRPFIPPMCRYPARTCFAGSMLLLLVAVVFREPLTASMFRHMLLHIPVIVLAGVLAARGWSLRGGEPKTSRSAETLRPSRKFNEFGVPGLLLVGFIGAYWMIPKALDQVMVSVFAEGSKFFMLFLAGWVLADSLSCANNVIRLFFVGNFCWMMAIIGLLYQDHPVRLCNFYLMGDQEATGVGLVVLAVALPVFWLLFCLKPVRSLLRRWAVL